MSTFTSSTGCFRKKKNLLQNKTLGTSETTNLTAKSTHKLLNTKCLKFWFAFFFFLKHSVQCTYSTIVTVVCSHVVNFSQIYLARGKVCGDAVLGLSCRYRQENYPPPARATTAGQCSGGRKVVLVGGQLMEPRD